MSYCPCCQTEIITFETRDLIEEQRKFLVKLGYQDCVFYSKDLEKYYLKKK